MPSSISETIKQASDAGGAIDLLGQIINTAGITESAAGSDGNANIISLNVQELSTAGDGVSVLFEVIKQIADAAISNESASALTFIVASENGVGVDSCSLAAMLTLNESATAQAIVSAIASLSSIDFGYASSTIALTTSATVPDASSSNASAAINAISAVPDASSSNTSAATTSAAALNDNAAGSDGNIVTVDLTIADTTSGLEALFIVADVLKLITDSSNAGDGVNINLTIPLSDSVSSLDTATIIADLLKLVGDTGAGAIQIATFSDLNISDSASVQDNAASTLNGVINDAAIAVDMHSLTITLPLFDTSNGLDAVIPIDQLVTQLEAAGAVDVVSKINVIKRLASIKLSLSSKSVLVGVQQGKIRSGVSAGSSAGFVK